MIEVLTDPLVSGVLGAAFILLCVGLITLIQEYDNKAAVETRIKRFKRSERHGQ